MGEKRVGLLGATSMVGECLLPLMTQSGWRVVAFSRQSRKSEDAGIEWRCIGPHPVPEGEGINAALPQTELGIECWICVAPIWVLPDYFSLLEANGARQVVALSSTSRFTKGDSSDPAEQAVARRLADGEARLQAWAESKGVDWVIVRPTMIYGLGKDKNVTEIVRLIRRWGFFPLLGEGKGHRQPVHAEDVAKACQAAITSPTARNRAYNLSGGEILSYKEMVKRIFMTLDKKPCLIHLPRWCFHLALLGLRFLPRFRHWSVAMADRMERDLVFDHKDAANDLGFSPRLFLLERRDLP